MRAQALHRAGEGGAPRTLRSWRALLALLVLLPVTLYLVAPHSAHAGGDPGSEQDVHGHSPVDMPVCRHDLTHPSALALPGDRRDVLSPTADDNITALPSEGPFSRSLPAMAVASAGPLPAESQASLSLYLLTQRLRI